MFPFWKSHVQTPRSLFLLPPQIHFSRGGPIPLPPLELLPAPAARASLSEMRPPLLAPSADSTDSNEDQVLGPYGGYDPHEVTERRAHHPHHPHPHRAVRGGHLVPAEGDAAGLHALHALELESPTKRLRLLSVKDRFQAALPHIEVPPHLDPVIDSAMDAATLAPLAAAAAASHRRKNSPKRSPLNGVESILTVW
jgi:hypothetical protein